MKISVSTEDDRGLVRNVDFDSNGKVVLGEKNRDAIMQSHESIENFLEVLNELSGDACEEGRFYSALLYTFLKEIRILYGLGSPYRDDCVAIIDLSKYSRIPDREELVKSLRIQIAGYWEKMESISKTEKEFAPCLF